MVMVPWDEKQGFVLSLGSPTETCVCLYVSTVGPNMRLCAAATWLSPGLRFGTLGNVAKMVRALNAQLRRSRKVLAVVLGGLSGLSREPSPRRTGTPFTPPPQFLSLQIVRGGEGIF